MCGAGDLVLSACVAGSLGARRHHRGSGDAHGSRRHRRGRLPAARGLLPVADVPAAERGGLPHCAHLGDGVLSLHRLLDLLLGVRPSRRPCGDRALGERGASQHNDFPRPRPARHLRPRLAARLDRDHRRFRAALPAAAQDLQHRSAGVRHTGCAQHPDLVQHPADGDGGELSQGRGACACDARPDSFRRAALRADGVRHHGAGRCIPRHCAVAARRAIRKLMADDDTLTALSAIEAAERIAAGELSSTQYVEACLERIDALDGKVHAFIHLDRKEALAQARALDERRRAGKALGPLHGVPVGIKDIFDTANYKTECGSPLFKGRQPTRDAAAVERLREAGAVIIGKTVSTEFAYFYPGATRNPHDVTRTPGGSSSGSAAAVAARMVPLAIGSQTNGSMIRPAAFCGVYGVKPSHGLISRARALILSHALDHVGVFARSLADAALILEVLAGYDADDPDTRAVASPDFLDTLAQEPPQPPRIAFVRTQ